MNTLVELVPDAAVHRETVTQRPVVASTSMTLLVVEHPGSSEASGAPIVSPERSKLLRSRPPLLSLNDTRTVSGLTSPGSSPRYERSWLTVVEKVFCSWLGVAEAEIRYVSTDLLLIFVVSETVAS